MTPPWPNARFVANSESASAPTELTPHDIVQVCRAHAASLFGLACLQIGFLPSSLQNISEALDLGWDMTIVGFGLTLGGYMLMVASYIYCFKLGGYSNLEAVGKSFPLNSVLRRYWRFWQIAIIALAVFVLVCVFAGSFVENFFNLPPDGRWLLIGPSQIVFSLFSIAAAYIWWQRGETVARNGAIGSAQH
jgi:hypothetical protein